MKIKAILSFIVGLAATAAITLTANAAELPERYDLREVDGALSEVKDQGELGTCWAYATTCCVETWLRLNGFGEYDFSERHMDVILSKEFEDCVNTDCGISVKLEAGGNPNFAITYWFSGLGPVHESSCPYIPDAYKGYSVGLRNDYLADTAGLMVKDIFIGDTNSNNYVVSGIQQDRINAVKSDIYNYGAVYGSYYANDQSEFGIDGNSYFESEPDTTNHAVALVGWDDNYPKENFISSTGAFADEDGAFIVRNSWSDEVNEDGYFYISYQTGSLFDVEYIAVSRMDYIDYDNIYSSLCAMTDVWKTLSVGDTNTEYAAQVFDKTQNEQSLNEITLNIRGNSSYEAYLIDNYVDSFEGGKLIASGFTDRTCIKTIEFDPIKLTGDQFAIVVKYSSNDTTLALLPMCRLDCYQDSIYNYESYKNRSFVSENGKDWIDTTSEGVYVPFIRAYTINTNDTHTLKISSDTGIELCKLVGANGVDIPRNPDGTFTLEDGTYNYTVTASGFEKQEGRVTVSGNDKNLTLKMKPCPVAQPAYPSDYFGIKDPADYEINLTYGYADEKLQKVVKVTVNGTKVKFTQNGSILYVDKSKLTGIKSKDKLQIDIYYKCGTMYEVKTEARLNSNEYRVSRARKALTKKLAKLTPSGNVTQKYLTELATEVCAKYGKNVSVSVTEVEYIYAGLASAGYYNYSFNISCGNAHRTFTYGDTFYASDVQPKLDSLCGWDAIVSSKTIANAIKKGSAVEITLGNDGIVPESFWKKVAGTKAVLKLRTATDDIWTVDCSKVSEISDMDFTVYFGSNLNILPEYSDESAYFEALFYIDKSMTTEAALNINVAGKYEFFDNRVCIVDVYELRTEADYAIADKQLILGVSKMLDLGIISSGSYLLSCAQNNNMSFGDIDGSTGFPNYKDYYLLEQRLADGYYNSIPTDSLYFAIADYDCNGIIDEADLSALKKYSELNNP